MLDPSDDNCPNSPICVLVKQAILLANNYQEMLLQSDEVDLRIKLWRDAIDICEINSERMSLIPV
jgi:hypothetical protein